jgi:hypothetical protein
VLLILEPSLVLRPLAFTRIYKGMRHLLIVCYNPMKRKNVITIVYREENEDKTK